MRMRLLTTIWICLAILPGLARAEDQLDLPALVEKELAKKVDADMEPLLKRFCAHFKVAYPLAEPTKSIADVQAMVDSKIDERLKKEMGITPESEYRAEASKKYAAVPNMKEIAIETASGEKVSGILYDNTQYWIKVSNRRISKTDLSEESLALVDDEARKRMIDQYIRRRAAKDKIAEDRFRERHEATLAAELYPTYGYVKAGDKWVPAIDYAKAGFAKKQKELEAKYRPYAENKVYLTRGYVKFDGRWMPIDEAQKLQGLQGAARAKAIAEAKVRADAAAKARAEAEAKAKAEAEAARENASIFDNPPPEDGAPPPDMAPPDMPPPGDVPPPDGPPAAAPPPPDAPPQGSVVPPEPETGPESAPTPAVAAPPAAPAEDGNLEHPFEGNPPRLEVPDDVPTQKLSASITDARPIA